MKTSRSFASMFCRTFLSMAFALPCVLSAQVQSIEGEFGLEWRAYSEVGLYGQDKSQLSGRLQLENDGTLFSGDYEVVLFGRYDKVDSKRSHADVREASWTYVGDEWSLKLGMSKEFWGVTESRHLVDVINQVDGVEGVDGEDKLGQPMLKFSNEKDWGTVDVYALPYFREREFVGDHGRLGLPVKVLTSKAQYESSDKENHVDFAVRYSHYIDDLDFAVAHFSGTGRTPLLLPTMTSAGAAFIPFYEQIDQTSLELQYIYDSWLLKFEGITSQGFGARYSAAVAGFEYTQVGIFDSDADLGWIVEYLYDDRKSHMSVNFEQDVFVGWRYAFNDADSSEILVGGIYDPKTEEKMFSLEASQRLSGDLKLRLEAWVFDGLPKLTDNPNDILASSMDTAQKTRFLQSEDFIQIELVKYF